jgi:uncharacterized membrane protein YfcA
MTGFELAGLLALGAAAGFLAGLFGIGGGMILVPFLTLILTAHGAPLEHVVHIAIATSLATILFTSISSLRAHHRHGAVLWPVARALAPGIVVGAAAGAQVAALLPTAPLAAAFAGFVGLSATQMLRNRKPKASRQLPGALGLAGAGGLIGVVSSLVGAGGAFVSVPFMVWCNVAIHRAVGTASALGFPIAAAGTAGYVVAGWRELGAPAWPYAGFVYLPALAAIVAMSVLTAPLGARLAHAIDAAPLKRGFALLLYLLAGYMLWKAIGA